MKTHPCFLVVAAITLATTVAAQTTPLRIEQTVDAQFPAALALSPTSEGEARIIINVDEDGKLVDWLVAGYTHKSFATEAVDVLKRWRYQPATSRGEPIGVRLELQFHFEAKGKVVSLSANDITGVLFDQIGVGRAYTAEVCRPRDLDHALVPVNPASPPYPGSVAASPQQRFVLVDFYVDEKGQPRMPVIVDSPHEMLSKAAVVAVNQWRFNAPTRAGKPVSVRVRQQFIFPASS